MTSAITHLATPKSFYDPHFGRQAFKIIPGEYWVTDHDHVVVTVLGSCVSACLHDPRLKLGGMNHFMLPGAHAGGIEGGAAARYGINAMEILVNELIKRGSARNRLVAKVFGGANVIEGMTSMNVGERNSTFIHDFLRTEGIRVAAEDLLDVWPRKVAFFPHSGRALCRKIKLGDRADIVRREREYERSLKEARSGDIELF
ncbi:MAG: chemoreceptor glutamine deamidase CheD [Burkholderiales bacterium]